MHLIRRLCILNENWGRAMLTILLFNIGIFPVGISNIGFDVVAEIAHICSHKFEPFTKGKCPAT